MSKFIVKKNIFCMPVPFTVFVVVCFFFNFAFNRMCQMHKAKNCVRLFIQHNIKSIKTERPKKNYGKLQPKKLYLDWFVYTRSVCFVYIFHKIIMRNSRHHCTSFFWLLLLLLHTDVASSAIYIYVVIAIYA